MRLRLLLPVVLIGLLLAPLQSNAAEATGSIDGKVTIDTPVPFVFMVSVYDGLGTEVATALSDAGGNFAIPDLAPGDYRLRIGDVWYDSKVIFDAADAITVEPGMSTSVALAMLTADFGGIEGRVFDSATGEGVTCVSVLGDRPYVGDDGSYRLYLSPGEWTIEFIDAGCFEYAPQWWSSKATLGEADQLTLIAGQTITGVDAAMARPVDPGGWISGTVYDAETGEPVPGICVTPYDESGKVPQVPTNASLTEPTGWDGKYRVGFLGEGVFRLEFADCRYFAWEGKWWRDASGFDSADPITVVRGEEVSGIDIELALLAGATRPTQSTTTTSTGPAELPFTGTGAASLAVLALAAMALGAVALRSSRRV